MGKEEEKVLITKKVGRKEPSSKALIPGKTFPAVAIKVRALRLALGFRVLR